MPKDGVNHSTLACLLGGLGITALATVCSSGTAPAAAAISGLLGWLGGVAGNRVADIMGRKLDSASPPADDIFQNRHISQLIGHAIASVAEKHVLNLPEFHTCRDEIKSAAKKAPEAWLQFIRQAPQDFAELREIGFPDILRDFATKNGRVLLLDQQRWEAFLHSFTDLPGGGCSLTPEALATFAKALHLHLAEALWNWVKKDFERDGQAYVATEMLFLSRILEAVEGIRKQPAVAITDELQRWLADATKRQEELIKRLDARQNAYFATLFAQNGSLLKMLREQRQTLENLPTDVAEELKRQGLVKPAFERRFDLSRILKYAPAELIGRETELQQLNDAWAKVQHPASPHLRVLTFVALGGEGKTSLVAKWAAELAAQDWPGCDAAFAWSFYSQGTREQLAASSDLFLKEALTFFGDDADKAFAASPAGAFEKGQRLARLVGQRRSLLILDGLEPLQYAPTAPTPGELKDQGVATLLKGLAAASHGLCVVTTRYSLPDLKAFWQTTAPEVKLLRLSRDAGVHLLKTLGVRGTAEEFATLVEDVKGHALTLTLLGGFLKRAFHGDIRQRDRVKFEKADEKMDGGHAFRTMAAYEQWLLRDGGDEGRREVAVLRLMGLFDRPADAGCLAALLQPPAIPGLTEPLVGLAEDDWEFCLTGLESARLITMREDDSATRKSQIVNRKSLDAHPHLREYFARQLRTQQPDAWRAAHRRLYEHLCASTPDKPQPTLEDLQPLYQAVVHGCQAGLQKDADHKVYDARIQRGQECYSTKILGVLGSDLGAIVCFFEQPWSRVSSALTATEQAWVLNEAAYTLRALGRLTEALEPMRTGLKNYVNQQIWEQAAGMASNLSELELTLGEVAGAVGDAEQSVTYADRSDDAFCKMGTRSTHADALHQAGRRAEAETRFREAEQMQQEMQPDYPLLYSVRGFKYCDLLLAAPERAAWQTLLCRSRREEAQTSSTESQRLLTSSPTWIGECRAVSQRAAQTLKESEAYPGTPLLDIALDHLTLGHATLYEAILERSAALRAAATPSSPTAASSSGAFFPADAAAGHRPALQSLQIARRELDAAVSGLRRAGTTHHIPRGLLTRAWLRFLTGACTGPESAQADLDEAWEIAERGPMKLFLADIHLYRARLFGGVREEGRGEKYPWESPAADLAAAEKLINACGYHRRDEELADAKAALG